MRPEIQKYLLRHDECCLVIPNCRIYLGLSDGRLKHKDTYYVTVIAVNKVGLKSVAYSKPVMVDDTPPRVWSLTFYPFAKYVDSLNTRNVHT